MLDLRVSQAPTASRKQFPALNLPTCAKLAHGDQNIGVDVKTVFDLVQTNWITLCLVI